MRGMRRGPLDAICLLTVLLAASPRVCARQAASGEEPPPDLAAHARRPVQVTVLAAAETDLAAEIGDESGEVSITRLDAGISFRFQPADRLGVAVSVNSELSLYDFEHVTGLTGDDADPWDTVWTQFLGARLEWSSSERLAWIVGARAGWSMETGADMADSSVFAGLLGARYAFSDRLSLGGGVAATTRHEDGVLVVPSLIIDWKITDQLRLVNDSATSSRLYYTPRPAVSLFIEGGWQFSEFRLDDNGPAPHGVGTGERVAIGVGAVWRPRHGLELTALVGAVVWQQFTLDDEHGDELAEVEGDATPFASLSVSYTF